MRTEFSEFSCEYSFMEALINNKQTVLTPKSSNADKYHKTGKVCQLI